MLAFFAVGTTAVAGQHQKAREPSLFTSEFILASTEAISLSSDSEGNLLPRSSSAAVQAAKRELQRDSDQLLGSSQHRRLTKVQLRSR